MASLPDAVDSEPEPEPLPIDEAIRVEKDPVWRAYLKGVRARDELISRGGLDTLDPSRWGVLNEVFAEFHAAEETRRLRDAKVAEVRRWHIYFPEEWSIDAVEGVLAEHGCTAEATKRLLGCTVADVMMTATRAEEAKRWSGVNDVSLASPVTLV